MTRPSRIVPYRYGDLRPMLEKRPVQPLKTTGMVSVPVILIAFCILFPVVQYEFAVMEGKAYATNAFYNYFVTIPFALLPAISLRNFLKERRAKCR